MYDVTGWASSQNTTPRRVDICSCTTLRTGATHMSGLSGPHRSSFVLYSSGELRLRAFPARRLRASHSFRVARTCRATCNIN